MKTSALKEKPAVQRLATKTDGKSAVRVERDGGRYSAGVIHGVSICSRGEALGHYFWCDGVFLDQIVTEGNANPKLLKSRFTHPDWCSDGLGKKLGTIENLTRKDDQVYGDLHFYAASHTAPDGDLAAHVMNLAEEDPTNFGLSIVFLHDCDSEDEFYDENMAEVELKDEAGKVIEKRRQFVSPDPLNTDNLPHARIAEIHATDVVDDPAANPNGLFHRPNAMLAQATGVLDFVFGKSKSSPALSAFGSEISPNRVREFFNNYLAANGLSLTKKESTMPPANTQLADAPVDDPEKEKPQDEPATEAGEGDQPKDDAPEDDDEEELPAGEDDPETKKETQQAATGELGKFCAAFGHEDGAKYLLAGDTFEAAQTKHIAALTDRLGKAEEKLAAFAKTGVEPVSFTAAKDNERDGAAEALSHDPSAANRAKFAAANAVPSKN